MQATCKLHVLHPAPEGKVHAAAKFLPLVGSKQDPMDRGHGAQYLYRPPPAGV